MSQFESVESPSKRQVVESQVSKRIGFSKRFRQVMGGTALISGVWMAASTDLDFSVATSTAEQAEQTSADEDGSPTAYWGLGAMAGAGVAVAAEKYKTRHAVDSLIDGYAGEKGAGFSTISVVPNAVTGLEEVKNIQYDAISSDVSRGADWLGGFLGTAGTGVATYSLLELYETFATNEEYINVWGQRLMTGVIAGAFVLATQVGNTEEYALDLAQIRLDNVDNGLGFEG